MNDDRGKAIHRERRTLYIQCLCLSLLPSLLLHQSSPFVIFFLCLQSQTLIYRLYFQSLPLLFPVSPISSTTTPHPDLAPTLLPHCSTFTQLLTQLFIWSPFQTHKGLSIPKFLMFGKNISAHVQLVTEYSSCKRVNSVIYQCVINSFSLSIFPSRHSLPPLRFISLSALALCPSQRTSQSDDTISPSVTSSCDWAL